MNQSSTVLETLRQIVDSNILHAKWLNSLSYLEYRGFRKIAKSHSTSEVSFNLLRHCAEEVRHAVYFKQQAIRIGGERFKFYSEESMLAEQDFKNYFFEIDNFARTQIPKIVSLNAQKAAYLLVTWLVEVRAVAVYTEYEKTLRLCESKFSLQAILREEDLHLHDLGTNAKKIMRENQIDAQAFTEFEARQFEILWLAIRNSILLTEDSSTSGERLEPQLNIAR